MTVVFIAIAALVIVGAVMVLTGRWDPGVSGAGRLQAPPLPEGPWTPADVRGLRFRVGLRGYRMQDVDAALAALATDLEGSPDAVPAIEVQTRQIDPDPPEVEPLPQRPMPDEPLPSEHRP